MPKIYMHDLLHFMRIGLKNPLHVGAVVPSSPALAHAMVHGIHVQKGETILELGPGTGPFTGVLDHILPHKNAYLGIEREQHFVDLLHRRYPEMKVVHGDALDAAKICHTHAEGEVRYILSGLPFASLPSFVREGILENIQQLMKPGCLFRTFQYVHAYNIPAAKALRNQLTTQFGKPERSKVIVRNVPPAFTFTWRAG